MSLNQSIYCTLRQKILYMYIVCFMSTHRSHMQWRKFAIKGQCAHAAQHKESKLQTLQIAMFRTYQPFRNYFTTGSARLARCQFHNLMAYTIKETPLVSVSIFPITFYFKIFTAASNAKHTYFPTKRPRAWPPCQRCSFSF